MATKENYRKAMEDAYSELSKLLDKQERLREQIERIEWDIDDRQEALRSLGNLCNVDPEKQRPELFPEKSDPEIGMTDAVRNVFKEAGSGAMSQHYTPVSVRDALKEKGFDLSKYKAPLASIHTILKRLTAQDELVRLVYEDTVRYGLKEKKEAVIK